MAFLRALEAGIIQELSLPRSPKHDQRAPHSHRGSYRGWQMDARQLELVVLALTSALLCGVAMAANHVMATGAFAGLTAAIGVIAVVLRRSQ